MKIKNDQSGIAHVAMLVLVVVVIGVVGFVGWKVWDMSSNKANTSISSPTAKAAEVDYFTIKEWGVRFPSVKSGEFSYSLPVKGSGSTPELTSGGPEDMQSVYVNVSGFTDEQNKCSVEDDGSVLGFTSIYRHKEQNPTIKYTTTFQLNPKYQVKIGDWYYSTDGLPEDNNCIEGLIPADYTKLKNIFNQNFKNLEKY
ncbi:MAG: hypothetical protein NTV95_04205 [Candidatus Saccharibacteria bacterium]|nr:hypothetical protein [Candidatus Saccharibacteria bacterium]